MRKMTNNIFVHVFTLFFTFGLAIHLTGFNSFLSTVLAEEAQVQETQPAVAEQGGVTERGVVRRDHRKTAPASPTASPPTQSIPPPPANPPPTQNTHLPLTQTKRAVSVQTVNGQYIAAEGGGAVNAKQPSMVGVGSMFTIIDLNGGQLKSGDKVQFRTEQGTYLSAEGGGGREVRADRVHGLEWETFTIREVGASFTNLLGIGSIDYGDPFTLQAFNGQYVVAEEGGGGALNANRLKADAWETFRFQGAPVDVTNCPICSQVKWLAEWKEASEESLGVAGKDVVGHRLGSYAAKSLWYPNSGQKVTVCGKGQFAFVYDPGGDEWDWNIAILPKQHYQFAITDAMKLVQPHQIGGWKKGDINESICGTGVYACNNNNQPYVMYLEVTPDEGFYVNPWLYKDYERDASGKIKTDPNGSLIRHDGSRFVGTELCVYGPWVRDRGHDFWPEIHPSELLWWHEKTKVRDQYYLMHLQDDSNRFDRPEQFSGASECVSYSDSCQEFRVKPEIATWWRPWAEPPRVGQFRIAFEADLSSSTTQSYTINEVGPLLRQETLPDLNHPQVKPNVTDMTSGTDHMMTFNIIDKGSGLLQKRTVLQVKEQVRFPKWLGVRFDQICRDATKNKLQGFISLTSAIGRDSKGKEGYQVLRVDRRVLASPATKPIVARGLDPESTGIEPPHEVPSVQGKLVPGSLRRVEVDGHPQLTADIEIRAKTSDGQPSPNLAITKVEHVEGAQGVPRPLQPADSTSGVRTRGVEHISIVHAVSLSPNSTLLVTLQSGEKIEVPLKATLSITPRLTSRPIAQFQPDPMVWDAWATVTGAITTSPPPNEVLLLRTKQWEINLTPIYAPLLDGKLAYEDDSPIGEELNEVIRENDPERMTQVLGSSKPFTIQWSFAATDLITRQPVAVKTSGPADPAGVRVTMPEGQVSNVTLQITFPEQPKPGLYELVATATITDSLGNSGSFSERIWSHFLGGPTTAQIANQLLQLIGALSGLPAEEISSNVAQADSEMPVMWAQETRARQLQTLRVFVEQAVEDQVVSFKEFSGLLGMAKEIGIGEKATPTPVGAIESPSQPPS